MSLPLPTIDAFFQQFWEMAYPQILLWCGAASGALLTIWIIKSFINK
jgi:hypothetical protein